MAVHTFLSQVIEKEAEVTSSPSGKAQRKRMNNGNPFFDHPILNSPYAYPERHWELDDQGQPTQKIVEHRRPAEFITPIPKPKKRKAKQTAIVFDEGLGLSTASQQYNLRRHVSFNIGDITNSVASALSSARLKRPKRPYG